MRSRSIVILLAGVVVVFMSFGLGVSVGSRQAPVITTPLEELINVFRTQAEPSATQTFAEVWNDIHDRYVNGSIDTTTLVRGAIRGMVEGLGDPYSAYFDPKQAKEFADEINGTFEGVGMEVGFKDNRLAVIAPLPETPAARSGLQAGDIILQIDKQDTEGWSLDQAIRKIRGPKGSTVVLVIRRGQAEPQEISVVRDTIVVSTVTAKILTVQDRSIGYIQISSFTEDTAPKVRKEIQVQLAKSVVGFVIDLRNNPGGLLDASVDVTSIFVDNEVVVSEVDQAGKHQDLRSNGRRLVDGQPVVVLVNGGSASASEIVAGALQDLGRATIVGQQTFGKGSVQQLKDLPDGSTLKLTIAKWYTPKNRSISDSGITPDLVIAPADSGEADVQLDKATSLIIENLL